MHKVLSSITAHRFAAAATSVLAATLLAHLAKAETFISAEPIPTGDVIGEENLNQIETLSYQQMEHWANRLNNDCKIVQQVILILRANQAIGAVNPLNTKFVVAAGGFEAITHPTFVLKIKDSGPASVSDADVTVLSNALGYVLSQDGTAHFSPDRPDAYDFPLDYVVVTFSGPLSGIGAKNFFDFLGTIDPALWSGDFAGFTQIHFNGSPINNSMLFLQPATEIPQFVNGISTAAAATPGAQHLPVDSAGNPTTAQAGVSFPGNDWTAFPNGDQYLANLGSSAPRLLKGLSIVRKHHLNAVADLLQAIKNDTLDHYLNEGFDCN